MRYERRVVRLVSERKKNKEIEKYLAFAPLMPGQDEARKLIVGPQEYIKLRNYLVDAMKKSAEGQQTPRLKIQKFPETKVGFVGNIVDMVGPLEMILEFEE